MYASYVAYPRSFDETRYQSPEDVVIGCLVFSVLAVFVGHNLVASMLTSYEQLDAQSLAARFGDGSAAQYGSVCSRRQGETTPSGGLRTLVTGQVWSEIGSLADLEVGYGVDRREGPPCAKCGPRRLVHGPGPTST